MKRVGRMGFGAVELLVLVVIVGVIICVGLLVLVRPKRHDTPSAAAPTAPVVSDVAGNDLTSNWRLYTLRDERLYIKYPASWTVAEAAGTVGGQLSTTVTFTSPASGGHYFQFVATYNTAQSANPFYGTYPAVNVANLDVAGSKVPLFLVAKGTSDKVAGLSIATTGSGATANLGLLSQSQKRFAVAVYATLVPQTPTPTDSGDSYSLTTYQAQPSYNDTVAMFKSLSY